MSCLQRRRQTSLISLSPRSTKESGEMSQDPKAQVQLHYYQGEDSVEYFLGLTPSGIIVLRNRAKVGNYFW